MATQNQNLSKREKEVVGFLLEGKSNKQIAFALGIADSTVEFHLKNVYGKLGVNSRAEAILKLGKSIGVIDENIGKPIVDNLNKENNNSGKSFLWKRWLAFFRDFVSIIKDTIFMITKEIEMKNRFLFYSLAGLVFGAMYWYYLSFTGTMLSWIPIGQENPGEGNPILIWASLSLVFLVSFCVWLVPAIFPAVHEFRHSKRISLSVTAVIVMWNSAVLGYYLIYLVLLAFVGLPNMDYYLIFGQHSPTFWQDWAKLFPKLILFKFLKWTAVGLIVSAFTGFVTSSLYSFWVRKTNVILPA